MSHEFRREPAKIDRTQGAFVLLYRVSTCLESREAAAAPKRVFCDRELPCFPYSLFAGEYVRNKFDAASSEKTASGSPRGSLSIYGSEAVLLSFLQDIFERLVESASEMTRLRRSRTLKPRDLKTALCFVLPRRLLERVLQKKQLEQSEDFTETMN
jgi:hypothetical protein